jgi:hypothetical protein
MLVIWLTGGLHVYAANISLAPISGTYKVGSTISIVISLTNNQDTINAVSAGLSFSNDTLELTSLSKDGSVMTLWAEDPTYSNVTGKVSFEGGVTNPGFSNSQGKILTLTFKVKKEGQGLVTISSGSVLANDGDATNVLGTLGAAAFILSSSGQDPVLVTTKPTRVAESSAAGTQGAQTSVSTSAQSKEVPAPVISSASYPDNTKWYSSRDAVFSWNLPPSVTVVRTVYGQREKSVPTKVYTPPISSRSFSVDGDGVMYMHVQFQVGDNRGAITSYKFQIDSQSPQITKLSFVDDPSIASTSQALFINAEDRLSGVDHLTISIDEGPETIYPIDDKSVYILQKQTPGKHTVTVGAVDLAGNTSKRTLDYTIKSILTPTIIGHTENVVSGDKVSISGITYASTTVEAILTRIGEVGPFGFSLVDTQVHKDSNYKETQTTESDGKGVFSIMWSTSVPSGIYEIKLRAIDDTGVSSNYTDGKVIVVKSMALVRFATFISGWLSLILITLFAIVASAATFWYSILQFSHFRRRVRRTMQEAEEALRANVEAICKDTEDFHVTLVKAQKKRELTKEEQFMLRKFKKRLDSIESEVEDKLESIR